MTRLVPILGLLIICSALLIFAQAQLAKEPEMTVEMRTWCVGRYTIELPATFEQQSVDASVGLPRVVRVSGLGPGTQEDLERYVNGRYAALEKGMEVGSKRYRADSRGTLGDLLLIGRRAYEPYLPNFDPGSIDVDAYFIREGHMFLAVLNTLLSLNEVSLLGESPGELKLTEIANYIKPHENTAVPSGPGHCMDRAFLNAPVLSHDAFSAIFRDPSTAGLAFSVDLSHVAAAPAEQYFDLLRGRRSGRRTIDGVRGDEIRALVRSETTIFEFAGGEGRRTGQPARSIRAKLIMNKDMGDLPSVTEAEMIWDHALDSLRMR